MSEAIEITRPVVRIDLRPGGIVHSCMRAPDGQEYLSLSPEWPQEAQRP